jgi:predicted  nucleic acid-binding Zn-ribbon protein
MNYNQTKKLEHDINAMQAKLGLLRAELKRCSDSINYEDIKAEIETLESDIDLMQTRFIKEREVQR